MTRKDGAASGPLLADGVTATGAWGRRRRLGDGGVARPALFPSSAVKLEPNLFGRRGWMPIALPSNSIGVPSSNWRPRSTWIWMLSPLCCNSF